ncbi:2'-5' RNA ligase family protein [Agromyces neolithicus]
MSDNDRAHRARSAVVVEFRTLDAQLDVYRTRLDPSRALGVPAHVTLLYPFVPPNRLDVAVWGALGAAIAGVPPFDAEFATASWFGRDVLWLAPTPVAPFSRLIERIRSAFPECEPYSGGVDEPVPHLTIADRADSGEMVAAAEGVSALLPLAARVSAVSVMAGSDAPQSWRTLRRFELTG